MKMYVSYARRHVWYLLLVTVTSGWSLGGGTRYIMEGDPWGILFMAIGIFWAAVSYLTVWTDYGKE